jgi:hypothetical protein
MPVLSSARAGQLRMQLSGENGSIFGAIQHGEEAGGF